MDDDEKIRILLTSAGMLMEDASARVILGSADVTTAVALLREVAHDLQIIATTVEIVDRVGRLTR